MPRSNQTGEFNTFVGGLVTEASPLTFPDNASIDEANFILNRNGSRSRRAGMDYEAGLTPYPISSTTSPVGDIAVSCFNWVDVAGITSKELIACQVHTKVYIIDRADLTLKPFSYVKTSFDLLTGEASPKRVSFASVDGRLIVAYGNSTIKVVTYVEATDTFTYAEKTLKTRDLFGVADTVDGKDLLSPEYINYRPVSTDQEYNHIYNLRNQGWAVPRLQWTVDTKADPITSFEDPTGTNRGLPSNADSPISSIYANTAVTDKDSDRFNDDSYTRQESARARAAAGHYIIDVLDRGASREAAVDLTTNPTTGIYTNANPTTVPPYITFRTPTVVLPVDRTEGGVNVVAEYAGRVWYGGFSSKTTDGDSQSPKLASYIFYSQLVQHEEQISQCYQEGDPTDLEAPDILDTDGGFIRLSGAYNIQAMVNIGSMLMVFAENGVWAVSGSDNGTFTANNQTVSKVTSHGCLSPKSIVEVDSTVMYWSEDAIYHIAPGQVSGYETKDISINISTLYQNIDDLVKVGCQGIYDPYEKKVRWLYNNVAGQATTTELVFDVVLAAFDKAEIKNVTATGGQLGVTVRPIASAMVEVSPFNLITDDLFVFVGADTVLSGTDNVVAEGEVVGGGFRSTAYLTLINSDDPTDVSFTFSTYANSDYLDWETADGVGVDAAAYLLTGYIGTGDYQRYKQVPYVYFHFNRTEDGFAEVGEDYVPTNQSSCLVQSQWDWSNSATSGKWGREFQAYRYKRRYNPVDLTDTYDYGSRTIVSRSKLRGRGRVFSLLISSEAGKDLQLLGWGMSIGVNGNV